MGCKFSYEPHEDVWCDVHQQAALTCVTEERDRYRAALEKMIIPGSGLACDCGVCYVCISIEALSLSEKDKESE